MARILVAGGTGRLGRALLAALAPLGEVLAPARQELDFGSDESIRRALRAVRPDIVVNAAGYTTVDKAESEPALALRLNGIAPGILAEEAKRLGALLVHYSTDYVYDGKLARPYTEEDPPNPVNAYGRTKLAGEQAVRAAAGAHLILRTSWIYDEHRYSFVRAILHLARAQPVLRVVSDQVGSPSSARALAEATAALLRQEAHARANSGIYHFSAPDHVSRCEFARAIIRIAAEVSGRPEGWARVQPITSAEYPLPAMRPRRPVTDTARLKRVFGVELPRWEAQLRAFLEASPALARG